MAIFLVCYAGQRLQDKSREMAYEIYSTAWYLGDPSMQKDVALMIMRAQRDLCITAGGFGIMSFETLKLIIQSIYSYLTLLSTQL